jgi:hypothetical protein
LPVLSNRHLARLVDSVVEEAVLPEPKPAQPGCPAYAPRLLAKVLIYGYAIGIRSSRQLERQCHENLAFLFLTRGDTPSYRTLCFFRVEQKDLLEEVFVGLFAVCDLHRGNPLGTSKAANPPSVEFTYHAAQDASVCPEGNRLRLDHAVHRRG